MTIVPPAEVAKEIADMIARMRADIASMLPPGERITIRIQLFDCVPFDLEIGSDKHGNQMPGNPR